MATIPQITVQLVHIQGPLKGEIQEFTDNEIRIGRHPDCQVVFPKDEVTLSRQHARIIREGNRFKLIDESTNGSYVNGKRVAEAFLKDGDVITFSENGPKVSFLTNTAPGSQDEPAATPSIAVPPPPEPSAPMAPPLDPKPAAAAEPPNSKVHGVTASPLQGEQPPARESTPVSTPQPIAASAPPAPSTAPPAAVTTRVPLAIQFGVALKSFQTLPITIGRSSPSDFIIDHPGLENQQAQIYFAQEQYWIKDLTGTDAVRIDGMPVQGQSPLTPDCQVSLSAHGPVFKFLAGGRLVELDDQPPAKQEMPTEPKEEKQATEPGGIEKKAGALFKKFFT